MELDGDTPSSTPRPAETTAQQLPLSAMTAHDTASHTDAAAAGLGVAAAESDSVAATSTPGNTSAVSAPGADEKDNEDAPLCKPCCPCSQSATCDTGKCSCRAALQPCSSRAEEACKSSNCQNGPDRHLLPTTLSRVRAQAATTPASSQAAATASPSKKKKVPASTAAAPGVGTNQLPAEAPIRSKSGPSGCKKGGGASAAAASARNVSAAASAKSPLPCVVDALAIVDKLGDALTSRDAGAISAMANALADAEAAREEAERRSTSAAQQAALVKAKAHEAARTHDKIVAEMRQRILQLELNSTGSARLAVAAAPSSPAKRKIEGVSAAAAAHSAADGSPVRNSSKAVKVAAHSSPGKSLSQSGSLAMPPSTSVLAAVDGATASAAAASSPASLAQGATVRNVQHPVDHCLVISRVPDCPSHLKPFDVMVRIVAVMQEGKLIQRADGIDTHPLISFKMDPRPGGGKAATAGSIEYKLVFRSRLAASTVYTRWLAQQSDHDQAAAEGGDHRSKVAPCLHIRQFMANPRTVGQQLQNQEEYRHAEVLISSPLRPPSLARQASARVAEAVRYGATDDDGDGDVIFVRRLDTRAQLQNTSAEAHEDSAHPRGHSYGGNSSSRGSMRIHPQRSEMLFRGGNPAPVALPRREAPAREEHRGNNTPRRQLQVLGAAPIDHDDRSRSPPTFSMAAPGPSMSLQQRFAQQDAEASRHRLIMEQMHRQEQRIQQLQAEMLAERESRVNASAVHVQQLEHMHGGQQSANTLHYPSMGSLNAPYTGQWQHAAAGPGTSLQQQMQQMLNGFGNYTVPAQAAPQLHPWFFQHAADQVNVAQQQHDGRVPLPSAPPSDGAAGQGGL
jgi:hypothetical protein